MSEGEVLEERQQASVPRAGRRAEQGGGSLGSGARNFEARGDVPGPTGRRTFLKGKGGPPWAPARPSQAPARASRAPPRAGPREGNKGAKRVSRQAAQPTSPGAGVSLSARCRASGIPAPRPGPSDRLRFFRLPVLQALTRACRPKPLRSSSEQAAGRARPGRGPRVTRKPQAAQVEPGKRHRKSRALSLPFLRGDLVTGKREVPPTGSSQRTSGPRHAAPQARSSEARAVLPAAAGGGRVLRDPGGGREEGRARAGRGSCGGQPSSAEAEQIDSPGSDPTGRQVGRC
ncbi:translation initiation factor IF-2-like [Mustela putorius furo]|uniref:Translation initiation factor IF-2-like n=1 Tax=Mustela putorius furo TaxID=9669 RepID=A0A8U0RFX9_MUSPF|nr:translation initiation factor IF-2-like [Mustela putorius furo]